MDRKIEKKYWTSNRILILTGIFAVISLSIYAFGFMDTRSTLNVDSDRILITEVKEGFFQETLQVTGTVQPIETIHLDAIEGGVVQEVYLESGANVQQGDTILTLANSTLQLQVMQQTSSIWDQINNARNSRLSLEQHSLSLQDQLADAKAQMKILHSKYNSQKLLYEKDLQSEQDFLETKTQYEYQKRRYELTLESFKKDSLQSITQLKQLADSEKRMYQNLNAVQNILDNLIVTAPISGQLSTVDLNPGQAINPGEKIGQVDVLDHYKVLVEIDEYHLSKIITGLSGFYNRGEKAYNLIITKISPIVTNGAFLVDMEFEGETPPGLRRGQSLRVQLQLSESEYVTQVPRGGFFQNTGGGWIFVLNEKEGRAYQRPITLGRNNSEYYEVLSGLQPGDKVITSGYDAFGESDILVLN